MPAKQTICLNMIVKDEDPIIEETLTLLLQYIKFDHWVICDTGSTDNTKKCIKRFFKQHNIPGEIYDTPWKDFGYNRTVAFEKAYRKSDYVFVWDADDEIIGDFTLPSPLVADSYNCIFGTPEGFRYSRCQLFNNSKKWKYTGVLHEFVEAIDPIGPSTDILGDYYFISGRKGNRNKDPNKYLKDALILDKAFNECYEKKDPLYNRYAFYCAQSYATAGNYEKAIEYYKKLLTLDNWIQEKYVACLEIGINYEKLGKEEESFVYLIQSHTYCKTRVECILRLIKYYCIREMPEIALAYYTIIQDYFENKYIHDTGVTNNLFVNKQDYDFYLPYYMIIVSERLHKYDIACKMYEIIFRQKYIHIDMWWLNNLFYNIQFCKQALPTNSIQFLDSMLEYIDIIQRANKSIDHDKLQYISDIVDIYRPILTRTFNPLPPKKDSKVTVLLTITSCKRFDLFKKTINSILHTWTDIHLVDYFLCVDDNSSESDRAAMKEQYPFINYYMKTPAEKGHRTSMNIIYNSLQLIKPTYWIHLEDDWLFIQTDSYVQKSINFLEKYKSQKISQILFNRNYAETFLDWDINGGSPLEPGFTKHIQSDSIPGKNCAYWPHYSFRPSMTRVDTILELGSYDSPNTFFERDYADKYYANGYTSGFFDRVSSLHIGKLTSDKTGTNAYHLNEESQFNGNILVVNLERRPDRKEMITDLFSTEGVESYKFYKAVDGKQLVQTDEICKLFVGNDFGNKRGVIGCALSHYNIWKQLIHDSNNEFYIIFEDDIKVSSGFKNSVKEYTNLFTSASPAIDVLFLGYHIHKDHQLELHMQYENTRIKDLDRSTFIGGTFAYIVSKEGAKKMVEYIKENGIKHGIDYVMKIIPTLRCSNAQPSIAFSDWFAINPNMDSDIQMDSETLSLTTDVNKDDWVFFKGVDSTSGDIMHTGGNIDELFRIASSYPECIAFNTLGYLKSSLTFPLKETPWIRGSEGIYIRKDRLPKESSEKWISMRLQGGLGNRLFQLAAALGLTERTGVQTVFYKPEEYKNIHGSKDMIYTMFPTIPVIDIALPIVTIIDEKHMYTYEEINTIHTFTVINGFRQCMKYFPSDGIRPLLHELLEDSRWSGLQRKYTVYKEDDKKVTWFIHVRLGDFCTTYDTAHITMDSYYKKVLGKIPDNANVLLFSDEPSKAYSIFKELVPGIQVVEESGEIECLSLMSQCWGGAIVPNSTFSWWGAYFAQRNAPESFKAYFPKEWVCSQYDIEENPVPSWGIQVSVDHIVDKDTWIFYEGFDSMGNYIDYIKCHTENGLFAIANATPGCKAFNTLGFLKSAVSHPLVKSQWFSEKDGIYIKKHKGVLRVKMMCNWCSSQDLCNEWNKMSKGKYTWNTITIVSSGPADYYVIINKPQEGEYYEPSKTIIFHMEPWCGSQDQSWGVKTWGEWATPDPSKFLQVRSHDNYINTGFWQVSWTYSDFKTKVIEKSLDLGNTISSVCSSKYFDPGHIKRIDFLKFLEAKNIQIDIYNSDNTHNFKSYKGRADPSIDKEKGIIPYKYYFMCENNIEKNFITEKLWEPILCETLCFYWGCPNVSEYIDPRAYVQLDMDDFEASYTIVQEAIKSNLWEQRLPYIKEAKEKVLEYYGFFPTLERILTEKAS